MPVGLSDFAELAQRDCYCFVDKTLFIKEVLDTGDKVMLITRPRRFGKTINMSMLRTFFEMPQKGADTKALFDGLLVANDRATMEHQGKYPVISLTLKSAKLPTWEEAYNELCSLICQEIDRHPQASEFAIDGFGNEDRRVWKRLLNRTEATQADWRHSLELLCKLLTLHHNKDNPNPLSWTHPIVLIDEYDAPIHAAYTNSCANGENLRSKDSYYGRMIDFVRSLFGNSLKDNAFLHRGILTVPVQVGQLSLGLG